MVAGGKLGVTDGLLQRDFKIWVAKICIILHCHYTPKNQIQWVEGVILCFYAKRAIPSAISCLLLLP